ncbi:MAG: hypothetical protein HPY83_18570 [Anaerolineae bacterium]|nr:hypothetical protein [Anaerolineae bacterium]
MADERAYEGYTLFCHTHETPEEGAGGVAHMYLIDMEGRPAHEWTAKTAVQFLQLLPNGNLLYSTRDRSSIEQAGLREVDPQSNVVWSCHCRIDHDYRVLENGNLLIHCLMDKMVPEIGPELKRCPYLIEITRDKRLVWEWFGEEHYRDLQRLLEGDRWEYVGQRIQKDYPFDWAHNNTTQSMPDNASAARDSRFRAGNILFSYRSLDVIGVIDRDTGDIVWAWGPGVLDGQHQPTMLPDGRILIFDNGTRRGWSRVVIMDPLAEEIVWEYQADPRESFFSAYISGAQLLPNGNLLVCEGAPGRLFEVTPDKEVVWEYRSPYPARHGIYRAARYSPEYVRPLLG